MSQREIIYLSFGSFSNHISTHFWNQQESYFSYDQEDPVAGPSSSGQADESLVDHDISFKAGQNLQGQDTYTPRTVIFDTQQEFGSLSKLSPLYESLDRREGQQPLSLDALNTWGSEAHMIAAKKVQQSKYQRRLQLEDQGLDPDSDDNDDDDDGDERPSNVGRGDGQACIDASHSSAKSARKVSTRRGRVPQHRFWSDYSRVYYHSKSLVSVGGQLMAPMSGSHNVTSEEGEEQDGRAKFETYAQGSAFFDELERDQEVLDSNLRWFAEDADTLQGFQYTIDTSDAFGGLGSAYLQHIHDEYPKASHMVFGAAWGDYSVTTDEGSQSRLARLRSLNNVLSLVKFMELSSITVPLRVPSRRPKPRSSGLSRSAPLNWATYLNRIDLRDLHHAGAFVSTHLETATLGSRLRSRSESFASLCARLNWRRDTKIAHLGGCLPVSYPDTASSDSSRTSHSDPVDAMLASYGYGRDPRSRQRGEPLESATEQAGRGVRTLLSTWLDLSLPSSIFSNHANTKQTEKKLLFNLQQPFAMNILLRNSNLDSLHLGLGMLDQFIKIREPFGQGVYVPMSYNILSSYPNYFTRLDAASRPIPPKPASVDQFGIVTSSSTSMDPDADARKKVSRPKDLPVVSALSTTPSTVHLLREARKTLKEILQGHRPLQAYGLDTTSTSAGEEKDMLKDVQELIEGSIDTYNVSDSGAGGDNGDEEDQDAAMGTDEEYDIDQGGDDHDLDWD